MKLIIGCIPCKDRFFLDKILELTKEAIIEVSKLAQKPEPIYRIVTDLFNGNKQILMIYNDSEGITEKVEGKPQIDEQVAVVGKLYKEPAKDFAGYVIIELWSNSLHVYQAYIKPEYQELENIRGVYTNIERQAKLMGAPYLSFCTGEDEMAKRFGFEKVLSKWAFPDMDYVFIKAI